MAGDAKRTKAQRLKDRERIAHLRLFHRTQQQIAEELGVDTSTVCRELKIIEAEWKAAMLRDIDAIKAEELRKLDHYELETLTEWERSKQDYTKKLMEDTQGGGRSGQGKTRKAKIETGVSYGDPRYMSVLLGIQDRRAKILGMDSPQKVAPTTPDGKEPYKGMSDAEMDARIKELAGKLGVTDPEALIRGGGS